MSTSSIDALKARNLVWHYTTLDALQLILDSGTLMATEVSYQNDPLEPETANDAIKGALQQLGKKTEYAAFARAALKWRQGWQDQHGFIAGNEGLLTGNSRFILCASTDPDNLYAWRTYASASRTGCAIGLDAAAPLGLLDHRAKGGHPSFTPWSSVEYDPEGLLKVSVAKLKVVGNQWNQEHQRDNQGAWAQSRAGISDDHIDHTDYAFAVLLAELDEATAEITAIAKHSSFRNEHETRVTISGGAFAVDFSPGRMGPRPRVRLTSTEKWGDVVRKSATPLPLLPIRSIMLAPNAGPQAATTTQWLLHGSGYPIDPVQDIDETGSVPILRRDASRMIEIFRSAHPYRDV